MTKVQCKYCKNEYTKGIGLMSHERKCKRIYEIANQEAKDSSQTPELPTTPNIPTTESESRIMDMSKPIDLGQRIMDMSKPIDLGQTITNKVFTPDIIVEEVPKIKTLFTVQDGWTILDNLYHTLNDGLYRRKLLDLRDLAISDKDTFIQGLNAIEGMVTEGTQKMNIKNIINQLTNA
jgi:hypothetical protein